MSGNKIQKAGLNGLLEELSQLEQRIKEIKDSVQKLPFEAFAGPEIEIIPVNKEGERIVLVRMKACPEFAFVIFAEKNHGSLWNLRINGSRAFSVCCVCCGIESYGVELPDYEQEEERNSALWALQNQLRDGLNQLCKEHGISHLFFRKAELFEGKYGPIPEVAILEADEYSKAMLELYGSKQVEQACEILQLND